MAAPPSAHRDRITPYFSKLLRQMLSGPGRSLVTSAAPPAPGWKIRDAAG